MGRVSLSGSQGFPVRLDLPLNLGIELFLMRVVI